MNSKARGRGNSTGIINPAFDGPDGQSKMPRNGRNDGEQQEKEEEESIGKRTRIFSSPITIDCRRSSDAYRDGSSFQSSRFSFSRYSNLRARSGDIASRIYHRKVERERERRERIETKRRGEQNQSVWPQSRANACVPHQSAFASRAHSLIDRITDVRLAINPSRLRPSDCDISAI